VTPDEVLSVKARESPGLWGSARQRSWAWVPPERFSVRVVLPLLCLLLGISIAVVVTGQLWRIVEFLVIYHLPLGMYTGGMAAAVRGLDMAAALYIVVLLHVFGGLFVTWNADYLKTLPWVGPRIDRMETTGRRKWERNPRLRDLGVLGVGLFTVAPVPGSGLVTGALLGRFVGLPWFPTFVAVATGGMVRVFTITLIAYGLWGFLSILH
jgi:uncharacterized membrane protein